MPFRSAIACVLVVLLTLLCGLPVSAESGNLTLTRALQRALAANPKLGVAEREIGMALGRRIQAGAIPNPELSYDVDQVFGTGPYAGTRAAETTIQLSQLIELGGKRDARISAGIAEVDSARWERAALRLEILSETATAFFTVLSGQRRLQIYDGQIAALDRIVPLLQRRVDAGASSPAEIARAQLAIDLVKAERERARTALAIARRELATLMGANSPDFSIAVGTLGGLGKPPSFVVLLRALDSNPQLIRWTAIRAQRDAELLSARLKPIPDVRLTVGRQQFRETNDKAVRFGLAVTVPLWDQNQGSILEAQESRAKADAERSASKAALILTLGKAYDALTGALRELEILQASALPNARRAIEGTDAGYAQGRLTLLEVLDVQNTAAQAVIREQEVLVNFHTAVATIEGLTGVPLILSRERTR